MNMNPTTPSKISKEILDFCLGIDSKNKPIFVPVRPSQNVRLNYCMTDVPEYIKNNGGSVKYGWVIWELPNIFLEAEFHAAWLNQEGELIDVTPKVDNESKILYLTDSSRIYQNQLVNNIRKSLVDNFFTHNWLIFEENKYQIKKKHFKNGEVDAISAANEFEEWRQSIKKQRKNIGANDPCYCESGKKFKKCCGRY